MPSGFPAAFSSLQIQNFCLGVFGALVWLCGSLKRGPTLGSCCWEVGRGRCAPLGGEARVSLWQELKSQRGWGPSNHSPVTKRGSLQGSGGCPAFCRRRHMRFHGAEATGMCSLRGALGLREQAGSPPGEAEAEREGWGRDPQGPSPVLAALLLLWREVTP